MPIHILYLFIAQGIEIVCYLFFCASKNMYVGYIRCNFSQKEKKNTEENVSHPAVNLLTMEFSLRLVNLSLCKLEN